MGRSAPTQGRDARSRAAVIPGLAAFREYPRGWLRDDVVAGLVLTALLVPQGMAYAELAGLPAITGLYTTILCLVGYALFGLAVVLFLVGFATGLTGGLVAAIVIALGVGSVLLAPAIVIGYAVKAADREDRERDTGR